MRDFCIDEHTIQSILHGAAARPARELDTVLQLAGDRRGLGADDVAALWCGKTLGTDQIYDAACRAQARRGHRLETFSPLYLTNTCDAECRMCGMRRDNSVLRRQTATVHEARDQLRILRQRGMHAVALLTGEYRAPARAGMMTFVNHVLRLALELGFRHVLINVGSVAEEEFEALLAGVPRDPAGFVDPKITMCTFQETYSRACYAKFMGTCPDNPRADFDRRLTNFDRSFRAGMRVANPGVLIGLHPDLGYELVAFALHAQHLRNLGMEVYLSVPRLRQIAGRQAQRGAPDDAFVRAVAILALGLPECKIVITTREASAMQHKLAPVANVISAGSSAVAPYTATSARFPLDASQFEVIDQRPFEDVLHEHLQHSNPIENFYPAR